VQEFSERLRVGERSEGFEPSKDSKEGKRPSTLKVEGRHSDEGPQEDKFRGEIHLVYFKQRFSEEDERSEFSVENSRNPVSHSISRRN
jgi:hypothetical protein